MICTSCGLENSDDQRFCNRCGRKLQSSFTIPDMDGEEEGPAVTRLRLEMLGLSRLAIGKFLEAWAYALALLAVTLWCGRNELYWPLYVIVPVLGLMLWRRRF
ncbi:zinc ribbon domain-containing protein [Desulfocurvibacter africanus]|uniref:Zinc-ribbon domain-containing protein n=1 Tax=Desulfocurvibacter africanus subsp. africanus str. Walvis Bay TaxID=690850 RepID=F3Z1E9_DESAF|nr:zinc ribbon domain-containing protein [Desulfocurvibacter africanus]EGJ49980.1 hypothetical protein Desaf_1644 [Desulfocurvibacter africanus subsp. africanus str. Walvis Bay]